MSTSPQFTLLAVFLCCLMAVPAAAQDPNSDSQAPANLAYVEGGVDLVHDGITERADPPMMLLEGDLIRTRSGRAEIVFADGTLVHLDFDAELEILGPERIRLSNGRVVLRVSANAARPYTIDTPAASIRFDSVGEYGIAANQLRGDLELTVARGVAEIDDGFQRSTVRGGQMVSLARAGARPMYQAYNSARLDAFAQWSSMRVHGFAGAQSAAQLPYELRPYGPVLDQHGRWDYVTPHGYVWFPSVGVAWRPYYDGWWGHTQYGWTWHGRDRWAWPTHHYGRWGFNGNFWFWIPARVWGPAWVSWGYAPGYVSWSPLGWDGRPVIGFGPGFGYNPWRSWTVVPRDHFGFRRAVRAHAIDPGRLDNRIRTTLITQNTPPATSAGFAVSRGSVATPGPTGNVRQANPDFPRRGNVRRPISGSAPEANSSEAPAAADAPMTAVPRTLDRRIRPSNPATPDAPPDRRAPAAAAAAEAPPTAEPPAGSGRERGRVRGGYAQPPPSARGEESSGAGGDPAGSVRTARPRGEPRAESPRSEGSRDNGGSHATGGARQRGGSAGAPAQSAPAQSGPPPSGGAVRRRPGV